MVYVALARVFFWRSAVDRLTFPPGSSTSHQSVYIAGWMLFVTTLLHFPCPARTCALYSLLQVDEDIGTECGELIHGIQDERLGSLAAAVCRKAMSTMHTGCASAPLSQRRRGENETPFATPSSSFHVHSLSAVPHSSVS